MNTFSILARTTSDRATAIVPGLRAVLRSMDGRLPLAEVRTLEDIIAGTPCGHSDPIVALRSE